MSEDYVICVRNIVGVGQDQRFGTEPGPTRFLRVPSGEAPQPAHQIAKREWIDAVLQRASTGTNPLTGIPTGDVLVFIHGYNNSPEISLQRHRRLEADLREAGYQGAVVSFDWPSAQSVLNYLEDRDDAKATARRLRDDGISLFSTRQAKGCEINVHVLGHSTGAYVIREAFSQADEKRSIKETPWTVSQVALIGGDISSRSLSLLDARGKSLYRHCIRLTNYQNPYDWVLKLSNTKRFGVAPRVGRVGLPDDASSKAVNVDCGPYFRTLDEEQAEYYGTFAHSWHIGNKVFAKDLCYTLQGNIDRARIPTRRRENGRLILMEER
ncbi:MAG: alpha/beta hydrolase [Nitrospirae bacterium]|nr:MAG: alpha/beta hydrolase [Nitrospirota bacterium]